MDRQDIMAFMCEEGVADENRWTPVYQPATRCAGQAAGALLFVFIRSPRTSASFLDVVLSSFTGSAMTLDILSLEKTKTKVRPSNIAALS